MKVITTKYLGPTNFRGSRVKATEPDGQSLTIPYNCEYDNEGNHGQAAKALCTKLNWFGTLHGGHTKNGMVWVFQTNYLTLTVAKDEK